jgi:hypothetical protein
MYVGGAEMTDAAMVAAVGGDVQWVSPHDWEKALEADRVVITGTDFLTDEAMAALAKRDPLVWVHHQQTPSSARQALFKSASPFVCMSDLHAMAEATWSGVEAETCHGWIDLKEITQLAEHVIGRADVALWAARNHPQKGRINARIWAQENNTQLTEVSQASREEVIHQMLRHKVFVFLPKALDACPRTLLEAEAAGCEIVTNSLAGRRDGGELLDVMDRQLEKFKSWL